MYYNFDTYEDRKKYKLKLKTDNRKLYIQIRDLIKDILDEYKEEDGEEV